MSEPVLKIGMIGFGTVGRGVAALLDNEAELYARRVGRPMALAKVLVRDVAKATADGAIEPGLVTGDADEFFAADFDVVVEVAGGLDPVGGFVERALAGGQHVVTANKSLLAARGPALFALARKHDAAIAFEASCGGGIPCVTALVGGLMANRITGLYGILNGTCNYILTQMTQHGESYADALAGAKEKGYAEADETLDVSGADSAQKLAILASLAFGANITEADIPCHGIDTLDLEDVRFGRELGYDIKLIASAERWDDQPYVGLRTSPCFIAADQLLAQVHGSFNALAVDGHAVGPTLFTGHGAGQMPTASAVVGDLLNVASGAYPRGFAQMRITPDCGEAARLVDADDFESRWYLRVDALNVPGVMAKLTAALGERGISLSALLQHEAPHAQSETVPVVITTQQARLGDLQAAAKEIAALDETRGTPVVIRILELAG